VAAGDGTSRKTTGAASLLKVRYRAATHQLLTARLRPAAPEFVIPMPPPSLDSNPRGDVRAMFKIAVKGDVEEDALFKYKTEGDMLFSRSVLASSPTRTG
jgi:hypothetical protein